MVDVGKLTIKAQLSQRMLSIGLGCEREVILGAGHGVMSRKSDNLPNQCYSVAVTKYLTKAE